jgi:plasmid stability protein
MNILIRNLSEKTVKELRKQAEENNRSLATEVKAILDERAEYRRRFRNWTKNADRIFNELKKTGQKFSDSTALIRRGSRSMNIVIEDLDESIVKKLLAAYTN